MTTEAPLNKIALELDARIEAGEWEELSKLENLAAEAFQTVLAEKQFFMKKTVLNGSEVSMLFTDDENITTINSDHRGQNKPTNVLSFPQHPADAGRFGPYLGDLVFASETIIREAALEKKPLNHHLQHLMVHGFLHLVGYDHECDIEAEEMESLEVAILDRLQIPNPYDLPDNGQK
ncbi:MAG: rRNA maturation RNase YbeY [Hyphomicrobiales bacterium]